MHLLYTKLYFILEKSVPNLLRWIRHKKVTADLTENTTDGFCFGHNGNNKGKEKKRSRVSFMEGRELEQWADEIRLFKVTLVSSQLCLGLTLVFTHKSGSFSSYFLVFDKTQTFKTSYLQRDPSQASISPSLPDLAKILAASSHLSLSLRSQVLLKHLSFIWMHLWLWISEACL